MFKVNDTFHRVHFPDYPITIKEIQTHKKESGKKVKLDKPIYTMTYSNSNKSDITMYESDITRQIEYNLWVLESNTR